MPSRRHEAHQPLVIEGGPIVTLDPERPRVEALLVREGRIAALGSRAEVRRRSGPDLEHWSLGGRHPFPAFVDHHVHSLNIGLSLCNEQSGGDLFLDLAGSYSEQWIAERVANCARGLGAGGWVLGAGWSQNGWAVSAMPRGDLLTEAAPEHPVLLARVDAHSAWVNHEALSRVGIGADCPDPPGGIVVRDPDGSPSGILVDRAYEPLLDRAPRPADHVVRAAFRLAADGLAARGFTRVYDAGFLEHPGLLSSRADHERYLALLLEEDAARPLPIDLRLMIMAPSELAEKVVRSPERYRSFSPRIGVTHVKLHVDGALGSRGAWLKAPYDDDPCSSGLCRTRPEELRRWAERALDAGFDVATHAIGDRANETVLDVYERILASRPETDPRRLRVEHFSYASREDRRRASRLGVVLTVQPGFVEPDEHGHVMEDLRLGLKRSKDVCAFGELHALGANIAGSSDDNAFVPNAMQQFFAAAARRSRLSGSRARWHPDQRLPWDESMRLFTRWYRDGGGDPVPGVLTEGAAASFVVLSGNPLEVPEEEILSIEVNATFHSGRRTFDDGSLVGPKRSRVRRHRPRARKVPIRRPGDPNHVFVIALDRFNRKKLEALRAARECRFHRLIQNDALLEGDDGYDVEEMIRLGLEELQGFPASVDAILAYRDFPESTIQPILAARAGVPAASLEAVLTCEHKYWSRLEQRKVIAEHVPRFERFRPFDDDARSQIGLSYPFWMKPVKSFASHLGFRVEDDRDFDHALRETRKHVRRLAEPFDRVLARVSAPPEVAQAGEIHCMAEQIVGGRQCTLEGCRAQGKTTTLGIVDSIRVPGSSSFLRYQYPSMLPVEVQQQMSELAKRVVEQIEYDNACFNVEFFWDEEKRKIWFLEVNPRIALHHADLFEKVDGYSNYEMAVAVALGGQPSPSRGGGPFAMAAACFVRCFKDGFVTRVPSAEEVRAIEQRSEGTLIEVNVSEETRLSDLTEQDAYSYSLAIVYVGGQSEEELVQKFEDVVRQLDIRVSPTGPGA